MTDLKVCKFGGTSMADGMTIERAIKIAKSDPCRRFFVVSAPGKRYGGEKKITDLLLLAHENLNKRGEMGENFEKVKRRFCLIERELHLKVGMEAMLKETEREIVEKNRVQFTLSRGEYLAARIAACALGVPFVDAEELFCFKSGEFLLQETLAKIKSRLSKMERAVIPGFYGADEEGNICTFPRGGGDVSGAVVARALKAALYENWTDVCGFLACDPRVVENPMRMKALSFEEMGELSRMGANVLHHDALSPVREGGIPVMILNTFRPQEGGTMIVPGENYRPARQVTGIAGGKNYVALRLKDRGRAPLFCDYLFSEGEDAVAILKEERLENSEMYAEIQKTALVAVVGQGLKIYPEAPARIFQAISRAGANVLFTGFASGIKFTIGVKREDFERVVRALYEEFFRE